MIGFLSFIILLAIAKMHAVIPDPQVNTCCSSVLIPAHSKSFINSSLSLNVWSNLLIHSLKGIFFEFLIEPLFKPGRGSGSVPSNLFFPLASIT